GKRLFIAARMGDINKVNQLLESGVSPNNWTDWQAKSALIAAEERHRTEVVMKLIASKADVNHQDHNGDTALHSAVWRFDTDVTKALLEAGAKPDTINSRGFTPLKYASFASNYHAHAVKIFIDAGANPNLQDEFGQAAMHFAVDQNKFEVVKVLLAAQADPHLKTNWGVSPIDIAVDENNTAILDLINTSTNSSKPQTSPGFLRLDLAARQLYEVARSGNLTRVDQLLYQGVSPDAYKDWQGSTCLILAAAKGHTEVVRKLIDAGADVNYKDHHDSTPLHVSVQSHETNMTQMLINAGANPNSQDKWGATPLLITMEVGFHPEILTLLLMAQAEPNMQDKIGVTALHAAVDKNMTETVHQLLEAGASPDIKTKWGKTAIDVAKEAELTFILNLLEGYTTTTTQSTTTSQSTTTTISTTTTLATTTETTSTVASTITTTIPIMDTTVPNKSTKNIKENLHKNTNSIMPTSSTIAYISPFLVTKKVKKTSTSSKAWSLPASNPSTITYQISPLSTIHTVVEIEYPTPTKTNKHHTPSRKNIKINDAVSKLNTPQPSANSSSSSNSGTSFLTGSLYTLLVIGLLVLIIAGILLYRRRIDNKGPPSIYLDARRIFREPIIDAFNSNILTQSLVPSRAASLTPEAPPSH
ncbi:unnamed protein product, partial [Meganyctiphanes norvegica]